MWHRQQVHWGARKVDPCRWHVRERTYKERTRISTWREDGMWVSMKKFGKTFQLLTMWSKVGKQRCMRQFKGPRVRPLWLEWMVEASLEQQLHNSKPREDDRLWNVWHLHYCWGYITGPGKPRFLWAWELLQRCWHTHAFHLWKLISNVKVHRRCWRPVIRVGFPRCITWQTQSASWSHAAPGAWCIAEGRYGH